MSELWGATARRGVRRRSTIEIDWDAHGVCVHPGDPSMAIAAAVGLCVSVDGGSTWAPERIGFEKGYCSAVAFSGDDILISVSNGPFAEHGSVFQRPMASPGSPKPVGGGIPDRLDGIVDTGGIAANGLELAVVDQGGNVYRSKDGGTSWRQVADGIPDLSSAVVARHQRNPSAPGGRPRPDRRA